MLAQNLFYYAIKLTLFFFASEALNEVSKLELKLLQIWAR